MKIVNTHVHMPPNFSAFDTVAECVEAAMAEGAAAIGISNFYDQSVYRVFADLAEAAHILPLFGLEFITLDPELESLGIKVNDPANPGRMYLTGKGISPFIAKSATAEATARAIREGNDARARQQIEQVAAWFSANGYETGITAGTIAKQVALRGDVPVEWVSIQERHIARAFEEWVSALPEGERIRALEAVFGGPAKSPDNPVSLQGEIRSRLLKAGTPGFVPEVPLSFDTAYQYILEMKGIPVYPTLADGVLPVCQYETPPAELAQKLLDKGIYAAEIIPIRNTRAVTDEYVKAFTEAGLVVMAGTEHNTLDRIPFDPACVDGPLSDYARAEFYKGTCVVAAHQQRIAEGRPGFVDAEGNRTAAPVASFIELGKELIENPASRKVVA
ncbi:MAG: hypothetical protein LBR21_05190 [Propionibacteriaceae bacterium]|jgi:methylmalonyl-CoA mutase cobalamin-binding subunit|nr:hypothetical protein [Propionibacteriaceae bacterium]